MKIEMKLLSSISGKITAPDGESTEIPDGATIAIEVEFDRTGGFMPVLGFKTFGAGGNEIEDTQLAVSLFNGLLKKRDRQKIVPKFEQVVKEVDDGKAPPPVKETKKTK